MFACGAKKKNDNPDKILNEIRSLSGMHLGIKLNEFKLEFNENNGEWKTNLNDRPVIDENLEKRKENIEKLKIESKTLDEELQNLEKEYLSKIAKLLLMAQLHCEIKTEINYLFDELGVSEDIDEMNEVKN